MLGVVKDVDGDDVDDDGVDDDGVDDDGAEVAAESREGRMSLCDSAAAAAAAASAFFLAIRAPTLSPPVSPRLGEVGVTEVETFGGIDTPVLSEVAALFKWLI